MIRTLILCSLLILHWTSVRANGKICHKTTAYERCATNSACDCLQMAGAAVGTGICGFRWATCSELTQCQGLHNDCYQSEHVCVHLLHCGNRPVCYPLSLADSRLCPSATGMNTTIPTTAISTTVQSTTTEVPFNILHTATWQQNATTIAGGRGQGEGLHQLNWPHGLCLDDRDGTLFIADWYNHRIVAWKQGDTTTGRLVAGGRGQGNRLDQLSAPTDVLVDKDDDSLIICDRGNGRVMRWSLRSDTTQGHILIDNIDCLGLAMDKEGHLYVTGAGKHEVRRYERGDMTKSTLVAGGNGKGDRLNQLNWPRYVFVDGEGAVYVSDTNNDRVMKWVKGATEGIVVAGGRGRGKDLTQLSWPEGVFVDGEGTVYVAEYGNARVTRWPKGMEKGEIIVGGNGEGEGANQFRDPIGLSSDRHGHLYVADLSNHRVQRFDIVTSP